MIRFLFALIVSLMPMTALAKSIVVLGDSISAGYGIEVKQGWVALLQDRLAQANSPYEVINASISGDTTAGGLARIDKILATHKPDVVLVELGANDGLRGLPPRLVKDNLAQITQRARKAGAKVLLLSMRIPPNYGKRYTEMFYDAYPQLSKELGVPYMPFILEDVALVKELMQPDGLHPNAKAQPMIADKVWEHLQPLLK
ncbi:arylesterase [Methylobacter sp. YRD-M1]|uniref:arylesterase n=1 Tax=Methylobacter sp. YRD-M1 TaxID=2911520 RepID=UPI00227C1C19|nr:arylesterase [Methylobacter sp. YRD-M1]WAK02215.1 arylesterase [Methylobacter sp. YRD-M1]